jgi:hypothetical protein
METENNKVQSKAATTARTLEAKPKMARTGDEPAIAKEGF